MFDIKNLKAMQISLASPETIRSWGKGEVKTTETINYRSQKPELDGLFCERIFGPSKDYQCNCGNLKGIKYKGRVCSNCGVEIISNQCRRERMGYINLAAPCTHIWYVKSSPSYIQSLLSIYSEISTKDLEKVINYSASICINNGVKDSDKNNPRNKILKKGQFLDDVTSISIFKAIIQDKLNEKGIDKDSYEYERGQLFLNVLNENDGIVIIPEVVEYISKYCGVKIGRGAEAIKELLVDIGKNIETLYEETKYEIENAKTENTKSKFVKRLEILSCFTKKKVNEQGKEEYVNKPEWMVLDVIPVIPPDLRPMLPIDGGRFATSDINELYRAIIASNNRLREKFIDGPSVARYNEKRILQRAVDDLLDNERGTSTQKKQPKDVKKSLTSNLKGKQGRFRQNLLGKRVDYSGRSVIAVGPDLKMYQCGIPHEMAIELLRPFIASILIKKKACENNPDANEIINRGDTAVYDIIEDIISEHPVLLNRAPTLHRLGIQAFQPKLVDGHAIRLHPLVCAGFNADFDGDQMAVHVPLSKEAQEEAINLMLASNNILGPKDGEPIVSPSQDMVLGNYYLTMEENKEEFLKRAEKAKKEKDEEFEERYRLFAENEGKVFGSVDDIIKAYETKQISLHNRIAIPAKALNKDDSVFDKELKEMYLLTSVGKIIFNSIFPSNFPYLNDAAPESLKLNLLKDEEQTKQRKAHIKSWFAPKGTNIKELISKSPVRRPFISKDLKKIIEQVFHRYDTLSTSVILDKIKDLGFKYSTVSGVTISLSDIKIVKGRDELIAKGDKKVAEILKKYDNGLITEEEKHEMIIDVWDNDKDGVKAEIKKNVELELNSDKTNPLFIIKDSGARGKSDTFVQLSGMRGIMNKPNGEKIEIPVKSCFREGMSVSEFFIASHGARKGSADTALKTADSGYLTRKLVDVSQDVIVKEEDCGTDHGFTMREFKIEGSDKPIVTLYDRIRGRYALRDIHNPKTGEIIVKANELITNTLAHVIADDPKDGGCGIKEVEIRSIFGCECKDGVCVKCYGRNLATKDLVKVGDAVGVMAAQSIGEPGTQLTMRTFHSGGVGGEDITQGLPRVKELVEAREPKNKATLAPISGKITKIEDDGHKVLITIENKTVGKTDPVKIPPSEKKIKLLVKVGDIVNKGDKLNEGQISPKDLLKVTDVTTVEGYLLNEIHVPYFSNGGTKINDKHLEIIIRQMLRQVFIIEPGDTDLLYGTQVDIRTFEDANQKALLEGKKPAVGKRVLLGIAKAASKSPSFLSAASFQETAKALTNAALHSQIDYLHGLKENVITGKLIPAGRGILTEEEEKAKISTFSVKRRFDEIAEKYNDVNAVKTVDN